MMLEKSGITFYATYLVIKVLLRAIKALDIYIKKILISFISSKRWYFLFHRELILSLIDM